MGPNATMAAGALAVLALLWAVAEARAARSRWGVVRSRLSQRGDGAFRSAAVTEAHARSVPGAVRIAGPMGIVVGLTAPLVCVPMTLDLMYRAFTDPYHDVPPALWCSVLSVVLLTWQCLFLVRAARMVLRCERGAGDTAVVTGKVGVVIQMLALLGWILAGTWTPALPLAMMLSALLTLANLMLLRAGDAVTQVQSQMTHDEWYALPGSQE